MTAKRALGRLLRNAYSGELAAAHAYRGHARSVRSDAQRDAIRGIESDEWRHRLRVGEMLAELGVRPSRPRELIFYCIGKLIALSCFVGGWFVPMYGAGRIERRNIVEYEIAARLAWQAGYESWADELLEMAEVEWDHEHYFGNCVRGHWLYRWFPKWPSAGPREQIRDRFAETVLEKTSPEPTTPQDRRRIRVWASGPDLPSLLSDRSKGSAASAAATSSVPGEVRGTPQNLDRTD